MGQSRSANSYGNNIRYAREQLGLSQQDLATRVNATPVTVSNWEREKTMPGPYHRQRLSEVFSKSLVELGLFQDAREEINLPHEAQGHPTQPVSPDTVPLSTPVWHIPYARNLFFTGREKICQALHTTLLSRGTAALSGLGGIGKTQMALEYAYRYRDHYRAVLWARADSAEVLTSDIFTIAGLLHIPAHQGENQSRVVQAVKRWLEQHEHWLLILDNADDLEMVGTFLPSSGHGHIILTTHAQATGILAESLALEKMTPEVGALLLLRRAKLLARAASLEETPPALQSQARRIVELMDGLPLALDQAGAYLEETSCGLDSYLALYQAGHTGLLQRRGRLSANHTQSVTTTLALCFAQVEQRSPAAAELLRLCAFLHPDTIQEEMISEGASLLGPVLAPVAAAPIELNEAINELRRFSLVRRNPDTHTLNVHRLVQVVLKDIMDEATQRQWAERAINIVNHVFPAVVTKSSVADWPQYQRYLPHVEICAELANRWHIESAEAAHLFDQTGVYLQECGEYQEAESFLQHALAIRQHTLSSSHSDVTRSLYHLANLSLKQGKFVEAERLNQQALHRWENAPEPDRSAIARSLCGLAKAYVGQSRFAEGEHLFLRALPLWEQAAGPDHPEVANALNGLAVTYAEQGKYAEVEALLQRALRIQKQTLGPDHPETTCALTNLGMFYYEQSRYAEAETCWQEALRLEQGVLGPDHPSTATMQNNLAELYINQGKYIEAEAYLLEALRLWEAVGPLFPEITYALINQAALYRKQGKHTEAAHPLQRARQIQEQTLAPDHIHVALTAHAQAELYREQGEYAEAEPLYQQALAIYEKRLGSQHPKTTALVEQYTTLQKDLNHR